MRICSMGPGDFITYDVPCMKPLIEVCVYVPWGREIMTRKCYDKEIPWHWNDGTNGVLAPLSGMALRAIPSSCGYFLYSYRNLLHIYPLVNVYIGNWNITFFLVNQQQMALFNSKLLVYQRVISYDNDTFFFPAVDLIKTCLCHEVGITLTTWMFTRGGVKIPLHTSMNLIISLLPSGKLTYLWKIIIFNG